MKKNNDIKNYTELIINTIPFAGFKEDELLTTLNFLNAHIVGCKAKEFLFNMGETISHFGIVLDGQILVGKTDFLGNQMILGENRRGDFFGETYAYLENVPLMVDVFATVDSKILLVDTKKLKSPLGENQPWFSKLLKNLLTASTYKNIMLSNRSFHTRSKSARLRISSYLSSQRLLHKNNSFSIPFNRQEMADYLNLDRSALSKELGRMKHDGLISYKKNKFTLNPSHFDL